MARLVCAYQHLGEVSVLPLVDAADCPGVVFATGSTFAQLLAPTVSLMAVLVVGVLVVHMLRLRNG